MGHHVCGEHAGDVAHCMLTGVNTAALQAMVQNLVRSALSLTFVISAARVVFNVKARMTREATWQLELKGDLTKQRRVEAVDKLMSVLTLLVAAVFGLQAIGLDGERSCPLQHLLTCPTALCFVALFRGERKLGRVSGVITFSMRSTRSLSGRLGLQPPVL